jgi:hypothetical protein
VADSSLLCGSKGCVFDVLLQNTGSAVYTTSSNTSFVTHCTSQSSASAYNVSHRCPSGANATAHCNASVAQVTTKCPYVHTEPSCSRLESTGSAFGLAELSGCALVSYSSSYSRFSCDVSNSSFTSQSSQQRRRRLSSSGAGAASITITSTSVTRTTQYKPTYTMATPTGSPTTSPSTAAAAAAAKSSNITSSTIFIGGVSAGAFVIAVLAFGVYYKRRAADKSKNASKGSSMGSVDDVKMTESPSRPRLRAKNNREFHDVDKIARGDGQHSDAGDSHDNDYGDMTPSMRMFTLEEDNMGGKLRRGAADSRVHSTDRDRDVEGDLDNVNINDQSDPYQVALTVRPLRNKHGSNSVGNNSIGSENESGSDIDPAAAANASRGPQRYLDRMRRGTPSEVQIYCDEERDRDRVRDRARGARGGRDSEFDGVGSRASVSSSSSANARSLVSWGDVFERQDDIPTATGENSMFRDILRKHTRRRHSYNDDDNNASGDEDEDEMGSVSDGGRSARSGSRSSMMFAEEPGLPGQRTHVSYIDILDGKSPNSRVQSSQSRGRSRSSRRSKREPEISLADEIGVGGLEGKEDGNGDDDDDDDDQLSVATSLHSLGNAGDETNPSPGARAGGPTSTSADRKRGAGHRNSKRVSLSQIYSSPFEKLTFARSQLDNSTDAAEQEQQAQQEQEPSPSPSRPRPLTMSSPLHPSLVPLVLGRPNTRTGRGAGRGASIRTGLGTAIATSMSPERRARFPDEVALTLPAAAATPSKSLSKGLEVMGSNELFRKPSAAAASASPNKSRSTRFRTDEGGGDAGADTAA